MTTVNLQPLICTLASHDWDKHRNKTLKQILHELQHASVTGSQLRALINVYQWDKGRTKAIKILLDKIAPLDGSDLIYLMSPFQWDKGRIKAIKLLLTKIVALTGRQFVNLMCCFQWEKGRVKATSLLTGKFGPASSLSDAYSSLTFEQFITLIGNEPSANVVKQYLVYTIVKPDDATDNQLADRIAVQVSDIDVFRTICTAININPHILNQRVIAMEEARAFITVQNERIDLRKLPTEQPVTYDHGRGDFTTIIRHSDGAISLKAQHGYSEVKIGRLYNNGHLVIKDGCITTSS